VNRVVFSSAKQDWRTPADLYKSLDEEFHFTFDPCPPSPKFGEHGLKIPWRSPAFCNPPYSEIDRWVRKAHAEWKNGATVVLLIPSRTDTRWWHDCCMEATEIRFIRGRLKFGGSQNNAPFPSVLVIFKSPSKK